MNWILKGPLLLALMSAVMSLRASDRFPIIQEAEQCVITCEFSKQFVDNIWARGRKPTPNFWGKARGDSVTWHFTLTSPQTGLNLGVRYAYGEAEYKAHYPINPKGTLQVLLDQNAPRELPLPDTTSFDIYETVSLPLPALSAGRHTLAIVAAEANTTRNLDTFYLFPGELESLPVILRKTIVAIAPSKHFVLRVTPGVRFVMTPEAIFEEFERIHASYSQFMGWQFPTAVPIVLIEHNKWPSNASAFQNDGGVFFRAEAMAAEQGNWAHEMTHMWYMAHFPRWFDEPSVRALTICVWCPRLYPPKGGVASDPAYCGALASGKDVVANPGKTYDSVEPILNALIVKHGPEVFSRFFHNCADAGKRGKLDFSPGRWMKKEEILKYMSQAAGEDVAPLFRRWQGFGGAQ